MTVWEYILAKTTMETYDEYMAQKKNQKKHAKPGRNEFESNKFWIGVIIVSVVVIVFSLMK